MDGLVSERRRFSVSSTSWMFRILSAVVMIPEASPGMGNSCKGFQIENGLNYKSASVPNSSKNPLGSPNSSLCTRQQIGI